MKKIQVSEKTIENSILSFLAIHNIFAWRNDSVGIYDAAKGVYRRKNSIHRILGVSDILGIYHGRPLAIEVKSLSGRLSDHQKRFLDRFAAEGGLAFVARSIDDVARELGLRGIK